MNINNPIKIFLQDPQIQQTIQTNSFKEFYDLMVDRVVSGNLVEKDVGTISQMLYSSGINPLNHLKHVPWQFMEGSDISSIQIPTGVVGIGVNAFTNCKQLKKIVLPIGLVKIDDGAFSGCSSLDNIDIPNSVSYLGMFAFMNCSSLKELKFPRSSPKVSHGCCKGCSNLTQVWIPKGVAVIEDHVFLGCNSLRDIYYEGSKIEWNRIRKATTTWQDHDNSITIHCTDEDLEMEWRKL